MGHDGLNALAVLTIHTEFISSIEGFDDLVIEEFARLKNRRINFFYK